MPNILICGTPGTGKTSLVQRVMEEPDMETKMRPVYVGELVKQKKLYAEFDAEYDCHVLDEDALLQELEPMTEERDKGLMLEYHSCDLFPMEWIDAVFVLRTDNTLLYDRLQGRGYNGKKLQENMECEIFQTILDEAREAFDDVIELNNNRPEDRESNARIILQFIQNWTAKQSPSSS